MKSVILWDGRLCCPIEVCQCFGAYCLLLVGLFFSPEDGGSVFLQNVGELVSDYESSHPRIYYPT
jgi:hypothetical protein